MFDVLVIYLNPEEEMFWKLCNASSISRDALVVDRSWEGEPLFLGIREGPEISEIAIEDRLGYVRQGKGLVNHPFRYSGERTENVEMSWEVSEGILVLCARKRTFE